MLKEISIMRPVLILQLVVFHAFIIYGGGWIPPMGYRDIPLYGEFAGWTYSFMLESFTFISGFIYFYTIKQKGMQDFGTLIAKKSKRLLLPMVVFGIVYFFMFENIETGFNSLYTIISGVGHLWYLMMLFWCFVWGWLLQRIMLNNKVALGIIAFLAMFCSWMPFPFQMAKSFYYLFFFYLPVIMVDKREELAFIVKNNPLRFLMLLWGVFLFAYTIAKYIVHFPLPYNELPLFLKAMTLSLNNLVQMVYATAGTLSFYMTALLLAGGAKNTSKDAVIVKVGNYCFGIYIFQQFILKFLYYNTPIPEAVGPYALPWVGVVFALFFSFFFTYLIRLTKVGRALL